MGVLWGNITSRTGEINLDINNDGSAEVVVNGVGLGIGATPSVANLHAEGNSIISEQMTVGSASLGSQNLNIHGSLGLSYQLLNSDETALNSLIFVDTSSGNRMVTLPNPSSVEGRIIHIKQVSSSGNVSVVSPPSFVEGMEALVLEKNEGYASGSFVASSGNWHQVSGTPQSSDVIASENLVLWMKFDETALGTAKDFSVTGNDGTHTLMAAANVGVMGKIDRGVALDGVNDAVVVPSDTAYDLTDFTISMWIKTDGNWGTDGSGGGDYASVMGRHDSSSSYNGFNLTQRPSTDGSPGKLEARAKAASGGATLNAGTANGFADDTWHHVVVVSSTVAWSYTSIYVNGVWEGGGSVTGAWSFNSQDIRIGDSLDGWWEEWQGSIDDLRIYNRNLTQNEIRVIHRKGL